MVDLSVCGGFYWVKFEGQSFSYVSMNCVVSIYSYKGILRCCENSQSCDCVEMVLKDSLFNVVLSVIDLYFSDRRLSS